MFCAFVISSIASCVFEHVWGRGLTTHTEMGKKRTEFTQNLTMQKPPIIIFVLETITMKQ